MMKSSKVCRIALTGAVSFILLSTSHAVLEGYWPLDELSGPTAPNSVAAGISGTLFNGANWVTDPFRGQVLQFDGIDGYVDVGPTTIPQMTTTNNFSWAFWSYSVQPSANGTTPNNNVIVGNRYDSNNAEFVPREFVKFTQSQFEFHRNGVGENINYADMPQFQWVHSVVVKSGPRLTYFRDGNVIGSTTITQGLNNPQPLYFGGSRDQENWEGSLDDVAIWSNALPLSSIVQMAKGTLKPDQVATTAPVFSSKASDGFAGGLDKWNQTTRGLENNAPAGYNAADTTGGQLTLAGTAGSQYWYGNSIESKQTFSSNTETLVSVDRVSLTGTGIYRSSLWILGDDGHYMHFSQNVGETGWSWNARDDGGLGTLLPTGGGNNIPALDSFDADSTTHAMGLQLVPTGIAGDVFIYILFDGAVVASQEYTNFPGTFTVALTGQARAAGDTVNAVFDNVLVQQVIPEPGTAALLGVAGACFLVRRRRDRR